MLCLPARGNQATLHIHLSALLGYLCFVAIATLGFAIAVPLVHDTIFIWVAGAPKIRLFIQAAGMAVLWLLRSVLTVTLLWSLYFLTDVVNRPASERDSSTA
jgi:hypothetical protein